MKIPADRVKVIDGAEPMGAPGFNPFRSKAHPVDATSILTMLEKVKAFEGTIRAEGFMKAVAVAVWHDLQSQPELPAGHLSRSRSAVMSTFVVSMG
jgi:hypothetical protein